MESPQQSKYTAEFYESKGGNAISQIVDSK
jgi:hypothetical protein